MEFKIGGFFPPGEMGFDNDCEAETSRYGFPAFCVRRDGHDGPHVAADAHFTIVEVWD